MKVNTNKNKNKKSVAKKTAVAKTTKKAVKKVTKTKNTKRKLNAAAPSVGRPRLNIVLPRNIKFSLDTLFNRFRKKITKVTLAKRLHEALANKTIKLVDKRIVSANHKGQPRRFYSVVAA